MNDNKIIYSADKCTLQLVDAVSKSGKPYTCVKIIIPSKSGVSHTLNIFDNKCVSDVCSIAIHNL